MTPAAIYIRSSKDRHALSLDAQRRALVEHATGQGLAIVAEYSDPVESGADSDRPGFQQLLSALKNPARGWSVILALDTSRIARRRHLALIFEHEAGKAGVQVQYRSVPDTDPITGMLLRSILQAMDEWHSMTSRAKGLAGMAESIRQGWRAGGRAPRGYRLEHSPTGAIRDGAPVMRSRLVPTDEAPAIGLYLSARAQGKPRGLASQLSGVTGSLNDLEWHAMTYAGHTTWGAHADREGAGYRGGSKRRPRAEWQITRDTHPAFISTEEAEAILAQLEGRQGRRNRAGDRVYLLSGLLVSPDGQGYSGETCRGLPYYRLGTGARVSARALDAAVLDRIFQDLAAPDVAETIAARMRAQSTPQGRPRDLDMLRRRLATLERKQERLVGLLAEDDRAAPALLKSIGDMRDQAEAIRAEIETARAETETAALVALWTPADVARLLAGLLEDLKAGVDAGAVADTRLALAELLERVEYDAETRTALIRYRLDTGVVVALPRGRPTAPVVWTSTARVGRYRAA